MMNLEQEAEKEEKLKGVSLARNLKDVSLANVSLANVSLASVVVGEDAVKML